MKCSYLHRTAYLPIFIHVRDTRDMEQCGLKENKSALVEKLQRLVANSCSTPAGCSFWLCGCLVETLLLDEILAPASRDLFLALLYFPLFQMPL